MKPKYLSVEQTREFFERHPDTVITVHFEKRTTGTTRVMHCRWTPDMHRKMTFPFNPASKDLFPVIDTDKDAPRMVPLDTVLSMSAGQKSIRTTASIEDDEIEDLFY